MAKNKPNQDVQIFGAAIIMQQLTLLVAEIEGVKKAEDIEAVHRMRVATRRLRSALPVFGPFLAARRFETWRKRIRGITRALGAARDADVQIEHLAELVSRMTPPERAGVRRLLLRIRQRRRAMQADVNEALRQFEKSRLVADMSQKLPPYEIYRSQLNLQSPALLSTAAEHIQTRLAEFLAFEPYVSQPECVSELHAMRIAAKQLRYTMEFFAPLYADELKSTLKILRSCQDALGAIHDADVWVATLPEFIEEERQRTVDYFGHPRPFKRLLPGLLFYRQMRQQEREQLYQKFVQNWQQWQQQDVWGSLRAAVLQPLAAQPANAPPATGQPAQDASPAESNSDAAN